MSMGDTLKQMLQVVPPLLLVFTCCTGSALVRAQNCEVHDDGHRVAEQEVRRDNPSRTFLSVTRREDLEAGLVDLQFTVKSPGTAPGAKIPVGHFQIMEIKAGGNRVENGSITASVVDLDDAPIWKVAYDCDKGTIFHLYGFSDDEVGFSNLMRSLQVWPKNESEAWILMSSFFTLTYPDSAEIVRDELGLMAAVMGDFQRPRSWNAFRIYWNRCPDSVKRQLADPQPSRIGQDFQVTFFTYVNKAVTKNSILFKNGGTISVLESKVLFAWGEQQPK